MRLVITGALGHIGSQLMRVLPKNRFSDVVLLDNLSTSRYCSLFELPEGIPFRFIEADICSADLEALFHGADVVVHLAAVTDAASSFGRRDLVDEVNRVGTERVAHACLRTGARLLFISTTTVYGTQRVLVDETCAEEDLKPQSPYAQSKRSSERTLAALADSDGLRATTLRCGTVFGASIGMRFHTAINKFVWQACVGQPLTVWETAMHQLRAYLHLEDAVRAILFVMQKDEFSGQLYNVLTTNASVAQIVSVIRSAVPDLQVELVSSEIMNQLSFEVSNKRFTDLGFKFKGSLESGILETIKVLEHVRPIPS